MAKYENVKKVVYPYLTHPKERYGLSEDLEFPENCIEVIRSRPFTFSARSCNKWSLERVILCGDSAHVFPPFGGQGIASGFRDASSLGWRLVVACRPGFKDHEALFQAWYMERTQQLEKSLAATIANGNFCNERSAVKTFMRNWYLWVLQLIPSWRDWLELGYRQEGMTKYTWAPGMPFIPALGGGASFPQVFFTPYTAPETKKPGFTDDVVFARNKKALFQIVVMLNDAKEMSQATQDLADLKQDGEGELRVDEATFIIDNTLRDVNPEVVKKFGLEKTYRIAYKNEYDPAATKDLPPPTGYDVSRIWKEVMGKYVIVRPDRFIFASCSTGKDLIDASRTLVEILSFSCKGEEGAKGDFVSNLTPPPTPCGTPQTLVDM